LEAGRVVADAGDAAGDACPAGLGEDIGVEGVGGAGDEREGTGGVDGAGEGSSSSVG
jgi:hypothetical protein